MSYWYFFCASAKMTHRYNTCANHSKIMEHLEQENKDLKVGIARLTAMMESVLAAQSLSSPMPITPPPQRTVISEVATSTIPAIAAHIAPNMPAGFRWGMPHNFVPGGFAPIFSSIPASSPIMSMPPHVVHTLPRVAPSDFTEMVNMGIWLEEGVREGRLSKEEASSSKRYGNNFSKEKESEANAVSVGRKRRPHVRRSQLPRQNNHQVSSVIPVFSNNQSTPIQQQQR
ncbi:hypothetical protein KIW84_010943 [Lathyrus oleraceus]|uniref:Uncharacterized protein n=1 Tax=Pisum sativum TaxID=3888 RepID=A0A9D4YLB8_PEA|nr:hypothetical protein KIW84_010943 [Pisum sativum]